MTVVGGRLLGVRTDSPDLDRRHRQDLMTWTPVAAYFTELRPNGQWAWQPAETTTAIAHALADQLEKGPDT
ncbi:hypothetical protein [Streptomyces sp. LaBMicrA B280]|uniref:hypothetical protein n=1 Tax=Streptomyces sp. LaBMicrA B280 TaxID=3391001 RepID=UPI003BA52443